MTENEKNHKSKENNETLACNLTDLETEIIRKSLANEINDLENEFRLAKDILFTERVNHIETKISQAKSGKSSEFLKISSIIDEACKLKCKIIKSRRDFSLEVANNEFDIQNQTVICDAKEFLQSFEFDLKESINTKLSNLILTKKYLSPENTDSDDLTSQFIRKYLNDNEDEGLPLPGIDLETRKRPMLISPEHAYMVYNLDQKDIDQDISIIMKSIRDHELEMTKDIISNSPDVLLCPKRIRSNGLDQG